MEKPKEPMTYARALNILGLKDNFADNELKKAYIALAKKHHPDNYIKSSEKEKLECEEKMKKINEAYKFLKDRKGSKTKNDIYSTFLDLLWFDDKCEEHAYLETVKNELLDEFNILYNNGGLEQDFRMLYVRKLENLRIFYYNWYCIDASEVKEELDYTLSLGKFCDSLFVIKQKHSKLNKILEQIHSKTKKYEENPLYNLALPHINRVQNVCLTNLRNSKWTNIGYFLNLMDKRISDIFSEFAKMIEFYDGFKQLFGPDIFNDVMLNHNNPVLLSRKYKLSKREIYLIYDLNLALNNPTVYKYIPDVLKDATSYFTDRIANIQLN